MRKKFAKTFAGSESSKLEWKGNAMRRDAGVVLVAVAWAAVACGAQSTPATNPLAKPDKGPAPCSVAPQPVPCGATPTVAGKPSATEQFPFPGEESGSSVPLTQGAAAPNLSGVPQTPDAGGANSGTALGAAGTGKTTPAFPFPGEDEKGAAARGTSGAGGGGEAGSSSSSSSSGSSSGDDAASAGPDGTPDGAGLQDKGSEGTPGRHLLHRVNPVGTKLQSADQREAEDLSVAKFYSDSGDLQGAYLRSQDAVKTAPDDPDAHFALAEAALKLNKRDEAIAEYKACLKLDPVDKEAKEARKALERLNP